MTATLLTFPWSCVMHDNHRLIAARGRKGLIASTEYRQKKELARTVAAALWRDKYLYNTDVSLIAECWFPDKRKRDAGNYRKLLTDAMTGVVYTDDAQLVSETWRRAGYDKLNPRIEVRLEAAA
jgi:Holliday junction resolvase RusA-like endonuclease